MEQVQMREMDEVSDYLTTDRFFPIEANSANLPDGETRTSLTDLTLDGSSTSSCSHGEAKLICKYNRSYQ